MPKEKKPPKSANAIAGTCVMCADGNSNKVIEAYLRGEKSEGEVARQYGIEPTQVRIHISKHLRAALRPAMRRIMMDPDTAKALVAAKQESAFVLVDKLAALSDRLDKLLEEQKGAEECPVCETLQYHPQHIGAIANLSKALLAYLHELGVWTGDIKSTILNINVQQNYTIFKDVVLEVLTEHPDVLVKVQEKLKIAELRQEQLN